MKTKTDALKGILKKNTMLIAFVVIVLMFEILTQGVLLVPQNVTNLIQQNSYILILAIGMLLCILSGGNVDLGVGSYVAFVGAVTAKMCIVGNMNPIFAMLLSLLVGAMIGAMNGYFIAYKEVPAFIATLASMLIFRGLTLVLLAGRTLSPYSDVYQAISTGFLPDFLPLNGMKFSAVIIGVLICPIFIWSQIHSRRQMIRFGAETSSAASFTTKLVLSCAAIVFFCFWLGRYEGIPSVLVLLVLLFLIYYFFTTKTVMGRQLYALGGNEKAAKLSGINTKRIKFLVFTNMGLLSAVAGIVFSGRLNAATPKAGTGFEMDAIASCYIGGASASGGVGTVGGAIIGALIMGVLNNGMSILGINVDWQQAIKGVVLLIAVLFDISSKNKQK